MKQITKYANMRTSRSCATCAYRCPVGCIIHMIQVRDSAVCDRFAYASSFDYVKIAINRELEKDRERMVRLTIGIPAESPNLPEPLHIRYIIRPLIRLATRAVMRLSHFSAG